MLTISEVASLLGVHRSTLYRTIGRSDLPLPIIRVGSRMRIPRAAVERVLGGELRTGVASGITVPTVRDDEVPS
jgi:excisionase family DNA binding protein